MSKIAEVCSRCGGEVSSINSKGEYVKCLSGCGWVLPQEVSSNE